MKPLSAIAIYLLLWTLTLFLVLPFGVRTADEAGEARIEGQAESAPAHPHLKRKLVATTLISAALFLLFWLNLRYGWVTLANVPLEWLGLHRVSVAS